MNKIERVRAALAGQAVDRLPFSIWYHFGTQHLPGEEVARTHLAFFRHYDLDWLKVMNDYPYPLPDGLEEVAGPVDLRRFAPLGLEHPAFAQQLEALRALRDALGGQALFVDTVFNPLGTAVRAMRERALRFMREHPSEFAHALGAIADTLARYTRAAIGAGAAGIFLSVNGANYGQLSEEEYERFVRPFDLIVLQAAEAGAFNICHAHGNRPMLERLIDYPCQAFNWSHRNTPPTLGEARRLTRACLIGGLDEVHTNRFTPAEVRAQVAEAVREAGTTALMIGPGCAVPTDIPPALVAAARDAARASGRDGGTAEFGRRRSPGRAATLQA